MASSDTPACGLCGAGIVAASHGQLSLPCGHEFHAGCGVAAMLPSAAASCPLCPRPRAVVGAVSLLPHMGDDARLDDAVLAASGAYASLVAAHKPTTPSSLAGADVGGWLDGLRATLATSSASRPVWGTPLPPRARLILSLRDTAKSPAELVAAGVCPSSLAAAHLGAADIFAAGRDLADMIALGYTWPAASAAGLGYEHLRSHITCPPALVVSEQFGCRIAGLMYVAGSLDCLAGLRYPPDVLETAGFTADYALLHDLAAVHLGAAGFNWGPAVWKRHFGMTVAHLDALPGWQRVWDVTHVRLTFGPDTDTRAY